MRGENEYTQLITIDPSKYSVRWSPIVMGTCKKSQTYYKVIARARQNPLFKFCSNFVFKVDIYGDIEPILAKTIGNLPALVDLR